MEPLKEHTSICRGCGAEIFFGATSAGKQIPLDIKPEKRFIRVGYCDVRMVDTYQSHFATCSKAGEFRRKS